MATIDHVSAPRAALERLYLLEKMPPSPVYDKHTTAKSGEVDASQQICEAYLTRFVLPSGPTQTLRVMICHLLIAQTLSLSSRCGMPRIYLG